MQLRFANCDLRLDAAIRRRRGGFSFTEILFAVIILGIGFIMVAAIFPVALQQSKSTTEETNGTAIGRAAMATLGPLLKDGTNPATTSNVKATGSPASILGAVAQLPTSYPPAGSLINNLWDSVRGNLIMTQDPRYAWVCLYRRGGDPANAATWDPYVQVFVFPVQVRATTTFDPTNDTSIPPPGSAASFDDTTNPAPNLMARHVKVAIADANANDTAMIQLGGISDLIAFDVSTSTPPQLVANVGAAAEGAYVVIANDGLAPPNAGKFNGRIFKLGARRQDVEVNTSFPSSMQQRVIYELQPGNDFTPDPGPDGIPLTADDITMIGVTGTTADAYLIGRGYAPGTANHEGDVMPVGAFTTFLKVN